MPVPPTTVGLLGRAVVVVDGEPSDPGGQKVGRVLVALAARTGQRVSTERLIDDCWGDSAPAQARASLQMHIAKLRKRLAGTPVEIETLPGGYRLTAPPESIDVAAFTRLVEDARVARVEGRWQTAADRSAAALRLWRGECLEALDDMPSLAGEATALRESRRQARLIRAEALLALGDHDSAVAVLEEAVAAEPFVEPFWELLMLALYRSGRQADSLAAFRRAAAVLGEELGIEPGPALARLEELVLLQDPALRVAVPPEPQAPTLPTRSTALVAREAEIAVTSRMAREQRLVTIVGPGGVGKTSLALEIAHRLAEGFPDGGAFFDLSACERNGDVAAVLADQLESTTHASALEAITDHVRSRSMVVVLDNCEHVLEGASMVAEALLRRCPDVHVIATSRHRLDVPGEATFLLSPLEVPPPGAHPADPEAYSSMRLFVRRLRHVRPDLDIAPHDLPVLGDICRRLDGLPLALLLVAAWSNVLTVADIGERLAEVGHLEDRRNTCGDRHGGLDAAIDWSFRLLAPEERSAFLRLSVFPSGFDLAAAATVLALDEESALGVMARLVDSSLLVSDLTGPSARYRMLETIRSFGRSRLVGGGEFAEIAERHRRYVLEVATTNPGADQEAAWFDRLHRSLPDLRVVLDWAEDRAPEIVVDLAERLRSFWTQRGLVREIQPRLETAAAAVDTAAAWYTLGVMRYTGGSFGGALDAMRRGVDVADDDGDRARLTNALGVIALELGDYQTAIDHYRTSEQLFTAVGHRSGVAAARLNQGIADLNLGSLERAAARLESARELFAELGDHREEAHALLRMAFVAELRGRSPVAIERARAALEIVRVLGPGLALADALQYTADFEVGGGDTGVARVLLADAVRQFVTLGHSPGLQRSMLTATAIAIADEQWPEAAEMSAYATELRARLGIPVPAANRPGVERLLELVAGSVSAARRDGLAERARLSGVDGMAARCLDVLSLPVDRSRQADGVHVSTTSE